MKILRTVLLTCLLLVPTTAFSQTLATYTLSAGWATFGLVLPQGAAHDVTVGALPTQTDIKTTWADGSTRFAVVTARVLTSGDYAITSGLPAPPSLRTPFPPNASVVFRVGTVWYMAATGYQAAPTNFWLDGALVREDRAVVTPLSLPLSVPQPLLQVVFDRRAYWDGTYRFDIAVQNVKDVAEGGPVAYDVTMYVGGVMVFTQTGITHPYLTRWHKVFWRGGPEATVVPDLEPFYVAHAIPRYLPNVADPAQASTGPQFSVLGYGDMSADMSSPGGRPEIAPYPNWVASYIVHERSEQRTYMLAQADAAGSWAGHIAEPDGATLISLDTYPSYWLDGRAGTHATPVYGAVGPNAIRELHNGGPYVGGWSEYLETAHMPSLAYVPYLVTGSRYYLDEMKYWVNFTLLATWDDGSRKGGKGILLSNQPRGIGWALRNLTDVAAYIPDADPMRTYFHTRLQNNLDVLDAMGKTEPGGPFEFLFVRPGYPQTPFDRVTSLWMNSYIGWALDHAALQGFSGGNALRDRIVRTQVRFFQSESVGYPALAGAPYYPTVGRVDATGTVHFFSTMKEVYDASLIADPRIQPFAGYYGPEARLMLQIGTREGVPGARESLDFLTPFIAGDIAARAGWALQ